LGPKSPEDLLQIVNLCNIRNPLEKPFLVSAVLKEAREAGSVQNIEFINHE